MKAEGKEKRKAFSFYFILHPSYFILAFLAEAVRFELTKVFGEPRCVSSAVP